MMDRSRTRIRGLGFFKDVDIKPVQGSAPDRTVLNVNVTEQSTGELSLGAGYSSTSSFVGQFSYTERNLFGRGQSVRASIAMSQISKEFQLSFTEPYFLDRPLSAGMDLYKVVQDFDQAQYRGDTTAAGLRLGFPTSEFGSVGLRYTYRIDDITPFSGAPLSVLLAAGMSQTSSFGYSYGYNTFDDPIRPRNGVSFLITQDFAGFGGSLKYLRTESVFGIYSPVIWDDLVGKLVIRGGYIMGYGGQDIRLNERFFKGGDTFRGFQVAGIGPRQLNSGSNDNNAIGGEAYAIGSAELRLPDFLPTDYGISASLFTDFGTLGHIAGGAGLATCFTGQTTPCVEDALAFRASAGLSIGWKSPFGPVQIDIGVPVIRTSYDKSQLIRFSAGTGAGL